MYWPYSLFLIILLIPLSFNTVRNAQSIDKKKHQDFQNAVYSTAGVGFTIAILCIFDLLYEALIIYGMGLQTYCAVGFFASIGGFWAIEWSMKRT